VHVVTGGGSFGRHLFSDTALEAVEASKAFGKPVKLMWSRTDDFRQGRTHPMATSRVRATYLAGNVLTYEQRHTSVSTDYSHGLGEMLSAFADRLPEGNFTVAQGIFALTANVSYNYGATDQLLDEVDMGFPTGSMRNIYSPDVCTAQELITDKLAKLHGKNPYAFRREFIKNARGLAVLDKVAKVVITNDLAVATSGAYARGDHVLDPHTRRAPEGVLSVTITGPVLATADAYATAAFAMGLEGPKWTARLRGYEAMTILADETVLSTPGFPAP